MPEVKMVKRVLKSNPISLYKSPVSGTEEYKRTLTFDFSDVEGYEYFTVDHFVSYMKFQLKVGSGNGYGWLYGNYTHVDQYDSNTGIVTVSYVYTTKYLALETVDRDYTELCVEVFYF